MSRLECERWASLLDREAVEGKLSRDDVAFQAEHLRSCRACSDELSVWRELRSIDPAQTPAVERDLRLEDAVLHRLWHEPREPRLSRFTYKRGFVALAGAVAAAAAVFVLVSGRVEPQPISSAAAHVTIGSGSAIGERGAARQTGAVVVKGETLRAGDTPLCLLIEPGIRACLSAGGELRLAEVALTQRRIELLSGRLVAALEPQPAGSSFAVSTRAAVVTAVGTIFAVEVAAAGEQVLVRVLRGMVKVRAGAQQERVLRAHQGLAFGVEAPVNVAESQEASDLALLRMDQQPPAAAPAGQLPSAAVSASASARPEPRSAAALSAAAPAVEPLGAGGLLREALELRAQGRFAEAAQTYRRLLAQHPRSAEARAALVSLGDLQLSRLHEPKAALRSFETYLTSGDRALLQEAEYGRIRALRALGRPSEEKLAIEHLLKRYPSGVHAESMRTRLQSLQGNAGR